MSLFGNLYNEDLTKKAKSVYMNLKDRADKDGKCFPSLNRISKDTSWSKSSVQRAINELVKKGYLEKEKRYRESNADTSNYYILKK